MKLYFTFLSLTLITTGAFAQAGLPDATFDNDGYVVTDFHGSTDFGYGIAAYPNGDFIIAGDADSSGARFAAFARFNSNGTYDNQLANTGRRTILLGGGNAELWATAIQADGRVIGAGSTGNLENALIFRMNPNGSLDGSFAQSGVFEHQTAGNDVEYLSAVKLQADGRIVATGTTGIGNDRNVIVFRLKTDGVLDSTFGSDGVVIINMGGADDFSTDLAIQQDGKIVLTGGTGGNILVIRMNTNGSMDNTFDTDGRLTVDRGYDDDGFNIAVQQDNKIVVSGRNYNGRSAALVLRLNADGTPDNNFGQNGVIDTAIGGNAGFYGIALQPDGKIICGGRTFNGQDDAMLLVRLNSDGTFDNAFAQGGIYTSSFTDDATISDITLLADGRLATTGLMQLAGNYSVLTAVFTTGVNVGLLDFNSLQQSILVYPNPVNTQLKLEFDLTEDTELDIQLVDLQGRVAAGLLAGQLFAKGSNAVVLPVSETLANGNYLLVLQSKQGRRAIRMQLMHQ